MTYPIPTTLIEPVTRYVIGGYGFKERVPRRWRLWSTHLGDDVVLDPGAPVQAIGAGQVVWAEIRRGSAEKKNWGGIVVIAHTDKKTNKHFYSVYGHITALSVQVGDVVEQGKRLGEVAAANTPENGWWQTPHLHFAIYTGPWRTKILPGHKRLEEFRTLTRWWRDPQKFITEYNQV